MIDEKNGESTVYEVLQKIKQMRRYRGESIHKAVLLLAIIELIKDNKIIENKVYLTEELEKKYEDIWNYFTKDKHVEGVIEYPFYYLKSDGFWKFLLKEGKKQLFDEYKKTRLTKKRLHEVVDYAYFDEKFFYVFKNPDSRRIIEEILVKECEISLSKNREKDIECIEDCQKPSLPIDQFVSYLNTLHSRDASNENALAESQACNRFFQRIYVKHPLIEKILEDFEDEKTKAIILTGHAGDGKSTIAASVFKWFRGIDENEALAKPLQKIEELYLANGVSLNVVKDLSEWTIEERMDLFEKVFEEGSKFLLVTNTGTLLETFCSFYQKKGWGRRADVEPEILEAIDREHKEKDFGGTSFVFYNLALYDNLPLARSIFEKMLEGKNWEHCSIQACKDCCPIYKNIQLLKENGGLAVDRLFMAYRKIYEYGVRLTIRQLTAHLAYLLTSGLQYTDIEQIAQAQNDQLLSVWLFYNRFFGDDGRHPDTATIGMPVFQRIREQKFGERLCPIVERRLWFLSHTDDFKIGIEMFEDEFARIRKAGARSVASNGLEPEQARRQVRRALFFLHDFGDKRTEDDFLAKFLGSKAMMSWMKWQEPSFRISPNEEQDLKKRIFHVLQEQFTGTHLPERAESTNSELYVTLNRKNQNLRQSAQVVVAQIEFKKEFSLAFATREGLFGHRKDLELKGAKRMSGINLTLDLPFLDYVFSREQGEVGETLQTAFADRLERFKAELIELCKEDNEDEMLLVRLLTDNEFRCQRYAVFEDSLEVTDA